MKVSVFHEGVVSKVVMDNPPMNLLTIDALEALIEAHKEADAHPDTRVIVTASNVDGMFSNGLDPAYVLRKSPEERVAIFEAVGNTVHTLFGLGKPHISVINGPAMAGGAVLAITSDFRIFDQDHGRISFSEPKVGLPIPEAISTVIRFFCSPRYWRDIVMLGKNLDAPAALECGLADQVVPGGGLADATGKLVERLARLSPSVLRTTKQGMRRATLEITEGLIDRDPTFKNYVGNDFLGEGLSALVEQRFPNFPS